MPDVNVSSKKNTPSGYRPETQVAQWMNLIPDAPADVHGKVFVMFKGIDSFDFLIQKGVTHFNTYDLSEATPEQLNQLQNLEGRGYDQAVKTKQQFSLPGNEGMVWQRPADKPDEFPWNQFPWIWNKSLFGTDDNALMPMTPEQGYNAGSIYSTACRIIVFENGENLHAVGQQWEFRRTFYEALVPRMEAEWGGRGMQWHVIDNYLTNGGKRMFFFGSAAAAIEYAARPVAQWEFNELLPGGTLELTNTWSYPIYLSALDLNPRVAYDIVYNGFLAHKANKFLFVFMQGFLEWRPNNFEEVRYQDGTGTLYKKSKLPYNMCEAFNYSFLAQEHCDGFIPFSMDVKINKPFQFLKLYHEPGSLYYPEGSTVPVDSNSFPHWIFDGDGNKERFPSNGSADYVGFGKSVWDATFCQVHGGDVVWCRFQVDNNTWTEASNVNVDEVCYAEYQKRGYLYTKKLGNKLAFYYLNVYADENLHTVKFQHPAISNITFSLNVHSAFLHAGLIDLSQLGLA